MGQFTICSAFLLGAERVIAIDHREDRLTMAQAGGADTLNFEKVRVNEALTEMTGGRGPDGCIDAVGLEAHGWAIDNGLDFVKTTLHVSFDRPHVLREAILACKKGGHLSIPGVYGGFLDKVPFGAAFGKGLTMKMGQTNMHKLPSPASGADPERQDRPFLRHQRPPNTGRGAQGLQDVPRQAGHDNQGNRCARGRVAIANGQVAETR